MKKIEELEAKKIALTSEIEKAINDLTDDSTQEELDSISNKTEEKNKLSKEIDKIKKINDLKKEMKAKKAVEKESEDEDKDDLEEATEDKITEEKEKSMNSFNINKGIVPDAIKDKKYLIGAKGLVSLMVREFGETGARNIIANDVGKASADYIIKGGLTSVNQPLVPQDMQGFIDLLQAQAVIRPLAKIIDTSKGNRTIPRMRLGATATWQGEGQAYTATAPDFDQINLTWFKLAALTYTTREFNNFSYMDMTREITTNLAQRMALAEDLTAILGDTSTYAPKRSLLSEAGTTLTSTGTDNITIASDLAKVQTTLENNFVSMDGAVVIGNPAVFNSLANLATSFGVYPFRDEIRSGYLNGFRIVKTAQIPSNDAAGSGESATANGSKLFFLQPKHLLLADSYQYNLNSTMEGSFVDGGSQINTFGQDLIAWKLANAVDFALEHPQACVVLQTEGWTTLNMAGQNQAVTAANTSTTQASGAIGKKSS